VPILGINGAEGMQDRRTECKKIVGGSQQDTRGGGEKKRKGDQTRSPDTEQTAERIPLSESGERRPGYSILLKKESR